ncbi:MotE family protein [Fredinandcohnia quinoae]|uniref:Magnesium transporter MgtE intracellular domain-containing protein n=1 Tax=Fredinandcohnia quinoae TaxID=2918902 RepID=A0AAW5E1L3_9BACI|nr:hypothetical protein [Fredinandcohnia sp. SECRCQ15]MCH1623782.1 hypothetical protein [Fredinandcohnia sp. SECRCQ15]
METTEKDYSKIQWFLFVIFIPTLFTVILVIVLLSVAGVNTLGMVKDFAEKVPVISNLFTEEEKATEKNEKTEEKVVKLQTEISKKKESIDKLEKSLTTKQEEIDSLKLEISKLTNELTSLQEDTLSKGRTFEELTKMYETMSPKNAALIIPNLKESDAKEILATIKTDKLAAILEKMSPEDAAKYTELLTK